MVLYDDMVWDDMVWYGIVLLVLFGMVWYGGMVWCSMVNGRVQHGMSEFIILGGEHVGDGGHMGYKIKIYPP